MKAKKVVGTLAAILVALALAAPAQAEVTAYVVHGINGEDFSMERDLPVDIFVSGLGCALTDFRFSDRFGPLVVDAGNYDISVYLAGEEPCGGLEVIDLDAVPLMDGANATIIAHRTADGSPGPGDAASLGVTASIFANDFSPNGLRRARLVAHHTALAPSVDVVVSRNYNNPNAPGVTVPGFANPTSDAEVALSQINADFRPGRWDVTLEIDGANVNDPTPLRLRPFSTTYVYAVGDFVGGTFEYLVYTDGNARPEGGSAPRLREFLQNRFGGRN